MRLPEISGSSSEPLTIIDTEERLGGTPHAPTTEASPYVSAAPPPRPAAHVPRLGGGTHEHPSGDLPEVSAARLKEHISYPPATGSPAGAPARLATTQPRTMSPNASPSSAWTPPGPAVLPARPFSPRSRRRGKRPGPRRRSGTSSTREVPRSCTRAQFRLAPGEVTAPPLFAGFGVTAPERGYDDYQGVDAKGKIVGLLTGAPSSFPPAERAHYASTG